MSAFALYSSDNKKIREKYNVVQTHMRRVVLFWGRFLPPDSNALAHRVISNAKILSDNGFDTLLVGYRKGIPDVTNGVISKYSIPYYVFPYPKTLYGWLIDSCHYKGVLEIINELNEKYDKVFVVINNVGFRNTKALISASKKKGYTLITDVVDWLSYDTGSFIYRVFRTWEEKKLVNILRPRINKIICISTFLKSYYEKVGCETVVIPSITIKGDVRFDINVAYEPHQGVKYCYAGNPGKNGLKDRLDWCISAFCQFASKDSTFNVFGVTKEFFCESFPSLRVFADDPRITFHGYVDNRKCLEAVKQSDFFLLAREDKRLTKAGFPTKVSESFALGTPVITTPSSDLAMYIEDGVNGFISKTCEYDDFCDAFKKSVYCGIDERKAIHKRVMVTNKLTTDFWAEVLTNFFR